MNGSQVDGWQCRIRYKVDDYVEDGNVDMDGDTDDIWWQHG